ncbi:acetate/propionate family kinase [Halomonas sp. TRM85114]|uniref:acetate/propionate family kinase n=1 Tax=Halomonas jincaotanensis TaxID=2810616 RepID=UPI001BD1C1F7|nr:acetate/propionate family kinase [Halomonas jincaotanensis]MBS9405013.1 acetate/propionate family kinase [Halomonas jincaotanensis]
MGDILVINSGSSSLKFALFTPPSADKDDLDSLVLRYQGKLTGLGEGLGEGQSASAARLKDAESQTVQAGHFSDLPPTLDHHDALMRLLDWIGERPDLDDIAVVGHRVVHGGRRFHDPVVLDADIVDELQTLEPLAPLHQPYGLEPIRRLAKRLPEVTQVACFDTAFHTTQPAVARHFALPRELTERGLIRYGFHGLSYDYINRMLPRHLNGQSAGRVVVAHLGNGASLCAIHNGRSMASTMGFTALDGLPMGTRCGSLDAGLVLHLLGEEGMSVDEVSELLYSRSGLLGVSGISSDMRQLLESDTAEAREAIDLFVYRIVREIGSLAAAMGGLDHLVFTAGIGERAAPVRQAIGQGCAWLGVELDDDANHRDAACISRTDSRVGAWVIPTDEERMIAWHANQLIASAD